MADPRFLQDGFDKRLSHAMEECGEFIAAGDINASRITRGLVMEMETIALRALKTPAEEDR
jgi:hypothetical protein